MRILLSWLKEFISLPLSPAELAHTLTMAGLEVDHYETDSEGETLFDISLTPNLSHCGSVVGIARELSALTGEPFYFPKAEVQEEEAPIEKDLSIDVQDPAGCPRYAARLIRGVQVGPSPDWLKERLEKSGVRSVNNIVDVTNYVLLETGHPLHAFDYDRLAGKKIIVRRARAGEKFRTLDDKEHELDETLLLICDREQPVALAGIMGGMDSEIKPETQNVVLECAYFDPVTIRKGSKKLGIQTDASKRFERGTDPNQVPFSLDQAALLIQQLAGGDIQRGFLNVQATEFKEGEVCCRLSRINRVIGMNFSRGEVEDIFKRLKFIYQWDGEDQFTVRIPTYRHDIKAEIDLVEEVARLYGYDHLDRRGQGYQASSLPSTPLYAFEKLIRKRLIGEGLQEFVTCDLIGPTLLQIVSDQPVLNSMVRVLNPTSIEQSILRTTLLPNLLQVAKYNFDHQNHDLAGFEIGRIHFREGEDYKEPFVIALLLTGKSSPFHWDKKGVDYDFFDLKGIVENLLTELGISGVSFKNLGLKSFHTGRQASVFVDSLELGSMGEVHPSVLRRLDVSQRILFAEFNLQDLMQVAKPLEKVAPLPLYPGSERDWTFTVKRSVPFAQIFAAIKAEHSVLLEKVSLKDIYRGEKVSPEEQNMTLRFVYRDPFKTIEQAEVEAEHQRLTTAVLKQLS